MRVTQNYSTQSLLWQVNNTRGRISELQRNLSTGKRINQISDAPEDIETVLRYRSMIALNEQLEENTNNASEFLAFTSNALHDSANILTSIKELTIQGIDSTSPEEFQAFATQVDELLQKLESSANTTFKGRYLFGGSNVKTPPFTLSADLTSISTNPNGIDGDLKAETNSGKTEAYNISGQEAFLANVDVFQTVLDIRDGFANNDSAALSNLIDQLDGTVDQVLEANTRAGARINRYELRLNQFQNENLRLREYLSNVENTNFPEAIIALQAEETALETALRTLSTTVNISLVDFI